MAAQFRRCAKCCFGPALLLAVIGPPWAGTAPGQDLDPALRQFKPDGLVRFRDREAAEQRREQLVTFIWPDGLPATRPVAAEPGTEPPMALDALDAALVGRAEALDVDVSDFDFHSIAFIVSPREPAEPARLALVHPGHVPEGPSRYLEGGVGDAIDHLLRSGFVVAVFQMPLVGWNRDNDGVIGGAPFRVERRGTRGHDELFRQLAPQLDGGTFRLFLEPVVQVTNELCARHPRYERLIMIGLSGGGWTTHMSAALDPRIDVSIPVAGALPLYARPFSPGSRGDAEQEYAPLFAEADSDDEDAIPDVATGVASWLEIFALGGISPDPDRPRRQIQLLNYYDSCCFSGPVYRTYDRFLAELTGRLGGSGFEVVIDESHKSHLISPFGIETVLAPHARPTRARPPGKQALDQNQGSAPGTGSGDGSETGDRQRDPRPDTGGFRERSYRVARTEG